MHIVNTNKTPEIINSLLEIDWPRISPISSSKGEALPYPVETLPPLLQLPIKAYQSYGQQPMALIACSALANLSLVCQSMANVARDKYLVSPTSLYLLTVADSGERKSAVDGAFSRAVRNWELKVREEIAPKVSEASSLHDAWKIEREGIVNQLKRAIANYEDTSIYKKALLAIDKMEPNIPLVPTLYFEDTTHEALSKYLATGWPSAALWSDEAGIVLGSHSMQSNTTRFIALLNRLWDAKETTIHRKTSENFTIKNRRLTLNLMMQPLLLSKMHSDKENSINRQSGFMARCLLAHPETKMGERFYKEPPQSMESFELYEKHVLACLEQSRELTRAGCINLPNLHMSSKAKQTWVHFFNQIESGLSKSTEWSSIKDFASKAAENAVRLAANLHLFQGNSGDIKAECIEQAIEIINWHLFETKRLLIPAEHNQQIEDAEKLIEWLKNRGSAVVTNREIQRLSPLRNKARREKAIEALVENHYMKETQIDGKKLLAINPSI